MGDGMGSGRIGEGTREGVDEVECDSGFDGSDDRDLEQDLSVSLLMKVFEQEPEIAYFHLLNELEEEVK